MPKPSDQGLSWMCSLRQNDVDMEHDAFLDLQRTETEELEEKRRMEEVKNNIE